MHHISTKRMAKITLVSRGPFKTMIGENRQLVTNEPVKFEEQPVEVQECRKITHRLKGIYRISPPI